MSAGNQNKYGLDELEFIPGESSFKKDAAWNKLQERMGERKKKPGYWYLAAASVLIVLSAGILLFNYKQQPEFVKNASNRELSKQPGKEITSSDVKDPSNSISNSNGNVDVSGKSDFKTGSLQDSPGNKEVIQTIASGNHLVHEKKNGRLSSSGNANSTSKKLNNPLAKSDNKNLVNELTKTLSPSESDLKSSVILTGSLTSDVINSISVGSLPPDVINTIPVESLQNQTAAHLQTVKKNLKVLHHNQLTNTLPVTNPAYSARSGNIQGTTVFGRNKSDDFIKIKITTPN